MLRSWRDAVHIALTPEHAAGVRVSRGLRSAVMDTQCVDCETVPGEPPWKPAISALTTLLSNMATGAGVATVVLSNRFVRYTIVPWSDQVTSPDEELAFARHCFRDTYGESARMWEVRVSPAGVGQPRVASAVDIEMLGAVRQAVLGSALRLRSVQPLLMAAYNHSRHGLDPQACLLLLAEKYSYTCMALVRGACVAVRSGLISGPLKQELPLILDREHLWSGMDERAAVFLYAPEHPDVESAGAEVQTANNLRPATKGRLDHNAKPVYRIAMTAA